MTQVVFSIALLRSNVAIPAKLVISGDVTAALNDRGEMVILLPAMIGLGVQLWLIQRG